MSYCPNCGAQVNGNFCTNCGRPIYQPAAVPASAQPAAPSQPVVVNNNFVAPVYLVSPKSRMVAALLCFFFGLIGVHRFYVGKIGTGILWIFTLGLLGIGCLVDFIMILVGTFKDGNGLPLIKW
jgi:hypothetical protein